MIEVRDGMTELRVSMIEERDVRDRMTDSRDRMRQVKDRLTWKQKLNETVIQRGWGPWSSGYGRSWVQITAPDTGWTFSHCIDVKIVMFV